MAIGKDSVVLVYKDSSKEALLYKEVGEGKETIIYDDIRTNDDNLGDPR